MTPPPLDDTGDRFLKTTVVMAKWLRDVKLYIFMSEVQWLLPGRSSSRLPGPLRDTPTLRPG